MAPIGRQIWAAWHLRAAEGEIEKRNFTKAQEHLESSLIVWSNSGETVFLAARTSRRAGNLEDAEKHLKDAQRLNWVPEAIAVERALIQVQSGGYRGVVSYLMSCVRRSHPDSLIILEVLAPTLARSYDVGPALECAVLWIERDPKDAKPYMLHAGLSERMRLEHEAIDMYRKALDLSPRLLEAHFRLGVVLLTRKLPGEALPHLEETKKRIDEMPESERPYVVIALAQCLHDLGRDSDARRELGTIPAGTTEDFRLPSLLGLIELDEGKPDKAEPMLRRAVEAKPFEPVPLSNLERCLRLNQKTIEADEIKKRIERIDADLNALSKLMVQVRQNPSNPEPRVQIAVRLMRNGQEQEARRWLESSLQQNPFYGPAYEGLADFYENTGDLTRAAEFRKRAKELPKSP
jgi:tetratricopeptide (TPR) repeat protein